MAMTKAELLYELTRAFSYVDDEVDISIAIGNLINPLTTVEFDMINGKGKIILSDEVHK